MELYSRDKSRPLPRNAKRPDLAWMLGCLGAGTAKKGGRESTGESALLLVLGLSE